jgi:putative hydrolase of the HAD superfamily
LNIIFDLGGVVITWDPDDFVSNVFDDKNTQNIARTHILDHKDWIELDRGSLSKNDAIKRGTERSGLPESEVKRLFDAVPSYLTPVNESIRLLHDLKSLRNKLFVLSNLHLASIAHLEQEYSFLELFDGKVISCRINKVKPESEIYEHLLDKYKLDIKNTIFIDDVDMNVNAAAALGIKTIHFKNINQCRQELQELGCLF